MQVFVYARFTFHSGLGWVCFLETELSFPGFAGGQVDRSVFTFHLGQIGQMQINRSCRRPPPPPRPAVGTPSPQSAPPPRAGSGSWARRGSRAPPCPAAQPAGARPSAGLSAAPTAPPHSPVPRAGIPRKKKEPGSLETLN